MGLDTVELIMAIEEEFGIDIPNDVAAHIATMGHISAYVFKCLEAQGKKPDPEATWEQVKAIVVYQLGVKPEEVTPDAYIVRDLGID